MGDVLSELFGVSTHKQLNKIKRFIQTLNANHNQLVNLVSESFSLLNKTNKDIQTNRDAINMLINSTRAFHNFFNVHRSSVLNSFEDEKRINRVINSMQSAFHVMEANLRDIYFEVLTLRHNIESGFDGHLTVNLLPPDKLLELLIKIQTNIPFYVKLPFEPTDENLIKYYQLINPTVLPDHYKTHIIFALPLVHLNNSFAIYSTVQLPYPNENGSLAAVYDLEQQHLVISQTRNNYALLTNEEYHNCKHAPVCTFTSPIYDLRSYPTCLTSLYLRDFILIEKYCLKRIVKMPDFPVVRHMFARHYAVATKTDLILNVICGGSPSREMRVTSVQHIVVPEGCELACEYFILPYSYHARSNEEKETRILHDIRLNEIVKNIWTSASLKPLRNFSVPAEFNLPFELADVSSIPLNQFQTLFTDSLLSNLDAKQHNYTRFALILLFCVIGLILCAGVILLLYCVRSRRRRYSTRQKTLNERKVLFYAASQAEEEPKPACIAQGLLQK
jgi:hypothetical protein